MTTNLNPMDVLEFLVCNGGRTTNNEIVQQFSSAFRCPVNGSKNKLMLKKLLHHTATLRRQGSNLGSVKRSTNHQEGKLIVLRKRFKGKSSVDIWCSLILTLPKEEIYFLQPEITLKASGEEETSPIEKIEEDEEVLTVNNADNVTSQVVSVDDPIDDAVDEPVDDHIDDPVHEPVNDPVHEPVDDHVDYTVNTPIHNAIHIHEDEDNGNIDRMDVDSCNREECPDIRLEPVSDHEDRSNESDDDVFEKDKPSLNVSVQNLRSNFDKYASTSDLTLADHLKSSKSLVHLPPPGPGSRPRRNLTSVSTSGSKSQGPLTQEGRAWLHAALRQEYSVLAKMAASNPSLVKIREPANGYTALHLATRWGRGEIVKLLAGTYRMNPNIRTWGGYTPLMIAGLWKKHEIYRILVEVYGADESLRDYGGFTSQYYLENRLQIPGFPDTREISHARDSSDFGTPASSNHSTTNNNQNNFMRDIKDSIRDSFRSSEGGIRASLGIRRRDKVRSKPASYAAPVPTVEKYS